ncbi:MAG: TldD/PmbA family protein [bacterium]
MKEIAEFALDMVYSLGATYADVRALERREQRIETKNGKVGSVSDSESLGIGIRVIADGAWGFASSDDLSKASVEKVAKQGIEIAHASALLKERDIVLAEESKHRNSWKTPIEIDPFQVPLENKTEFLLKIDEICRKVSGIQVVLGEMGFIRNRQIFISTEGSFIEQTTYLSGVGYSATAADKHEIQKRSYPCSFGGQWSSLGYELLERWPLVDNAQRIAEEAVALLKAKQCPSGIKDIILEGSQLGLQIHESCGHPIELDRVLGQEANYAGTSFLTPEKLGQLRYGSDIVNLVADATLGHGPGAGTFGYDDEGVPAQRTDIVKDGMFVGYLTSRETAFLIGQSRSNGAMRASGWNRIPLIRMTNISLLPGEWELDDLIADTKDGILMETNRSWSIDDKRLNFQFGTEIGWEIKNGKKTQMLKNPTYGGMTPQFWNSCDAVCNKNHWVLWGVPNCGKGQPSQIAATGHGAAPARFRKINVGVGYLK